MKVKFLKFSFNNHYRNHTFKTSINLIGEAVFSNFTLYIESNNEKLNQNPSR